MKTLRHALNHPSVWTLIGALSVGAISLAGLLIWPKLSMNTQVILHGLCVVPLIYTGWIALLCCIYRRWFM